MNKIILDPCCGSRMMWFDKKNENVVFGDIRDENHILCDGRVLNVNPDVVMDFRDMPFADNTFKLISFDPPHLERLGESSWMAKKYGKLSQTWREDLKKGFDECWRVLDDYGTLVLKWNESQIKAREVLAIIDMQPLFGHTTGRQSKTIWMCFMKIPK
jgi:hypothetical protein